MGLAVQIAALLVGAGGVADRGPVRAELLDGRVLSGRILDSPDTAVLRLETGRGAVPIPVADLLAVHVRSPGPDLAAQPGVVFANGDRVAGSVGVLDRGVFSIRTETFGDLAVRASEVSAVLFAAERDLEARLAPGVAGALLANDSFVAGPLRWLSAQSAAFDSPLLGLVEVPRERVKAVVLAGAASKRDGTPLARVHLLNGDVVTGRSVALSAGEVRVDAPWLARAPGGCGVPLGSVERIAFLGGRIVPLTDLKPAEIKTVPFFDFIRSPRLGTSVDGRRLRIGRRTYAFGFGAESRTELAFALDGRYAAFAAEVGIDEEVGDRGSVEFIVELDGKAAWRSGVMTGAMDAKRLYLKLAGAKTMRLIVDFADEAHVGDHADWAEPVLISGR